MCSELDSGVLNLSWNNLSWTRMCSRKMLDRPGERFLWVAVPYWIGQLGGRDVPVGCVSVPRGLPPLYIEQGGNAFSVHANHIRQCPNL